MKNPIVGQVPIAALYARVGPRCSETGKNSSGYAVTRTRSPSGQLPRSLSAVSEARVGKMHARAWRVCALSIQRLEGSRPRLRRTRALCQFNRGKVGRRGAPKLCGEARRTAPRGLGLAEEQNGRKRRVWRSGKKRLVRRQGGERRIVQKHAAFPSCGESFHAAAVIMRGGERSWISAAVSLSMTSIGPPHWGQSQS